MSRHRVATRAKVRGRRLRAAGLALLVAALGSAAVLTLRHLARELAPDVTWEGLKARVLPRLEAVSLEGAPESLRGAMLAELSAAPGGAAAKAEALRRAFPSVRSVRARRDWLRRSARFEVAMRGALARAERKGRPAAFLDEAGVLFAAPEALYPDARVAVEVGSAPEAELAALARCLAAMARSESLVAALERMRYVSAEDGWEASFADGTRALWGDLSWTEEKLERLREVVLDARERFEGGLTADLRYFEDGKVLVRPRKG